jgi:pyrimidine-specific ribonucleoside hydrolase
LLVEECSPSEPHVHPLQSIPVVAGASKALCRPERVCPEIHGQDGLGTKSPDLAALFPSPEELLKYGSTNGILSSEKAVNLMASVILNRPGKVTLVLTGAMTNAALLLSVYPEVKEHLEQIVFMGGSMGVGNTSPMAEWNIEIDPEAAKTVLASGVRLVMVPLNVTHTALVSPELIGRIRKLNSPFSELVVDLLCFFEETYLSVRAPLYLWDWPNREEGLWICSPSFA